MCNSSHKSADNRVLAVVVLYRRAPSKVDAWPVLCQILAEADAATEFGLKHCLLYDNSPEAAADAEITALPPGVRYHSDPGNGGTLAAYGAALQLARELDCGWLLLMDQDTALPLNYLAQAAHARNAAGQPIPAALLPGLSHGDHPVSPAVITANGSVRAGRKGDEGIVTALSSGLIVQVAALEQVLPAPAVFWLDYLDHWIFLGFHRLALRTARIEVMLEHELSVQTPAQLSSQRLASILAAERRFYHELGWRARLMRPLRLIRRALAQLRSNPRNAGLILKSLWHV